MNRKDFIKMLSVLSFSAKTMELKELKKISDTFGKSDKMPVLFIGHGSPMNALLDNQFTQHLHKIAQNIEKPKAILVVSAHWLTTGKTYVSVNPSPKTIYDFGGFPEALYQVKYEPKGSPDFAREVIKEVKSVSIIEEHEMGLDHGAWSVLRHIYPDADIPVFQLSIDYSKPSTFHFELAKELQSLRKKGVLILGSGNIVHNLRQMDFQQPDVGFDWAKEFDETVKTHINNRNFTQLLAYQALGTAAKMSVPTPDHYYPMLYSLGLCTNSDEIKYTYEGLEMGSISMRCFQVG